MASRRHLENLAQETLDGQQKHSLLIAGFLQQLALPSVFNRELTEEDYELWRKLLVPYPAKAIEYAFDNWGRNGKTFPKPANILELIGAWGLSNKAVFTSCGKCQEGWVMVSDKEATVRYKGKPHTKAIRCSCFTEWAARKNEEA